MHRRQLLTLLPALAFLQGAGRSFGAESAPTRAFKKNSANIGVNLAPVTYWSTEHPFTNLAMNASRWRLQENNAPFSWDLPLPAMSPEEYPLVIPPDAYLESFLIFTSHRQHLTEILTVSYDGVGQIEYAGGAELVTRGAGFDQIRNLANQGPLMARMMRTEPDDPLRNVRVHSGAQNSKDLFRPEFLDRLSKMSALRFMDWMDTNNSKTVRWDQRPKPNRFTQSEGGVALEYMVALANQLIAPPWFTMPHLADDDYIRQFAQYVHEHLNPAVPVYIEYSNEIWNTLFEQANHAAKEGLRRGLSTNEHEARLRFNSLRTSEILTIWEKVFGADKDRVIGVYAAHGVNDWTSEVILSFEGAADHADVLAIAPYFGGGLGGRDRAPEVSRWSLSQLFDELADEVDGPNRVFIEKQAQMASRFNVGLVAYEGGQHLFGHNGTEHDVQLERLFSAANRDERMGELYKKHIRNWQAAGGGMYALYNSMGEASKWGSWGLLEYEAHGSSAPKWQAVLDLLSA